MTIDNNLNSMVSSELKLNEMATNIAQVANTIGDPELQEVSADLIDSIVGQIPEIIAYTTETGIQITTEQAVEIPGTATITVTSPDGASQVIYVVHFSIAANTDASLSEILVDGNILSTFNPETTDYVINLANISKA